MCGIVGYYAEKKSVAGKLFAKNLATATDSLIHRGPDACGFYEDEVVGLGHRRLSILDVSSAGNQPMWDLSNRYAIIYNGEIYNFEALKSDLRKKGIAFGTKTDTEVLLQLYITEGPQFLEKIEGFFALAIYDQLEKTLFLARDRFGIKPLYLYQVDGVYAFASELGALMELGIERTLNLDALSLYLQFNYVPAPQTILQNVSKVMPGTYSILSSRGIKTVRYYNLDTAVAKLRPTVEALSYEEKIKELRKRIGQAVSSQLISDVPLGTLLSGGVDSSIITAEAVLKNPKLKTFSVGFEEDSFFDETEYAELVSKKLRTDHRVFRLSEKDFLAHVDSVLNSLSEPFADSSALGVSMLSQKIKDEVTVALSGDGADEIFAGYEKHAGLYRALHPGFLGRVVSWLGPLWRVLPKSRHSFWPNVFRKLDKFARSVSLLFLERVLALARFSTKEEIAEILDPKVFAKMQGKISLAFDRSLYRGINGALRTDIDLVLANDMLVKVDRMSMLHGLEIRVPFLDTAVVEFAMSLPENDKINKSMRKKILQDAYRDRLPAKLYNRPKQGFEIPLRKWLIGPLASRIEKEWLNEKFITEQNIFSVSGITELKKKLFSKNSGDSHIRVWNLIVFQSWWRKYMMK